MPQPTFFNLPEARRTLLVEAAIAEFAEYSYAEASLSRIARSTGIAKGSFYQYFEDKLDLYRWLLCDEAPRRKRVFLGEASTGEDFWAELHRFIERGMAFLVEHPRLARLLASAADPAASGDVRGLHAALCEAGNEELQRLLARGVASGALAADLSLPTASAWVAAVIGPGLTAVILQELGAELHELLAASSLKRRLGPARRKRLTDEAVRFLRDGLASKTPASRRKAAR